MTGPQIDGIYTFTIDFSEVDKEEWDVVTVGTYYNRLRFYDDGVFIGICSEEHQPFLDRHLNTSYSISGHFEVGSDNRLILKITEQNPDHDGPMPRNQNVILGKGNSHTFDHQSLEEVFLISETEITVGEQQFLYQQGLGRDLPGCSSPQFDGIYYAPFTFNNSGVDICTWLEDISGWATHIEWLRFYQDGTVVSRLTWAKFSMSDLPDREEPASISRRGTWTQEGGEVLVSLQTAEDVDQSLAFKFPSQGQDARKKGRIETSSLPNEHLLEIGRTHSFSIAPDGTALYRTENGSVEQTYSYTPIYELDGSPYLARIAVEKNHDLVPIEEAVAKYKKAFKAEKKRLKKYKTKVKHRQAGEANKGQEYIANPPIFSREDLPVSLQSINWTKLKRILGWVLICIGGFNLALVPLLILSDDSTNIISIELIMGVVLPIGYILIGLALLRKS
jgi:hypothetical protein